jgi:energy-coupling factor transporter transmembrane protein EcfT
VATMLRRSSEIGDALLARGFSLNRPGNEFLEIQRFRLLDFLVLLVLVVLAAFVLAFHFNFLVWLKGSSS